MAAFVRNKLMMMMMIVVFWTF